MVVVVAAGIGCVGAVASLVAAWVLVGQVRRLERGIEALRHEAVPLVEEARAAAGHAASEIARVDAVLADTEAVTASVDRAARVVRRTFANPVVTVLAWRAGAAGGLRRLRGEEPAGPRRAIGVRATDAGRYETALDVAPHVAATRSGRRRALAGRRR